MSVLDTREVDRFINKAHSKSSMSNDGVRFKVYKCPRLKYILFLLLRKMWEKKDVAERWEIVERIYWPKEENSENLGQFRPISLLNTTER